MFSINKLRILYWCYSVEKTLKSEERSIKYELNYFQQPYGSRLGIRDLRTMRFHYINEKRKTTYIMGNSIYVLTKLLASIDKEKNKLERFKRYQLRSTKSTNGRINFNNDVKELSIKST